MIALEYGKRAEKRHFRPDDNEWNLDLSFLLEKECIYDEMERVAGNIYTQNGAEKAYAYADSMMRSISSGYTSFTDPPAAIWKKAVRGELQGECPKWGSIFCFKLAFWFALSAEVVVMGVQAALSGDINPFIFVLAFILGLGGFLQGLGAGNLLFYRWKNRTGRPHNAPETRDWILVGLGTVLILLISTIRGSGGFGMTQFFLVFLITLFFGEAVAICEASAVDLSRQRIQCHEDFANCQRVQASQMHTKNLDEGNYRRDFEIMVNNASMKKFQRDPDPVKNASFEPSAAVPN